MNASSPSKSPRNTAFSLVELLVVVAIMSILMVIGAPSFLSSQRASALTSAGNRLVDSMALARQAASSRNTVTCLVLLKGGVANDPRQTIGVLEYDQMANAWRPITSWLRIPEAARIVDFATPDDRAASNQAATAFAPFNLRVGGEQPAAGTYSTVLFYPEGGIASGNTPSRRFSVRTSENEEAGSPDNFYDVVINSDTSAYLVVRP